MEKYNFSKQNSFYETLVLAMHYSLQLQVIFFFFFYLSLLIKF